MMNKRETRELTILAQRAKQRRQELGLSQGELARRIGKGVSQPSIYQVESGETRNPRFLLALAAALGVTPSWLMGDDSHLVSPPPSIREAGPVPVPIKGHVAAGDFRPQVFWPPRNWQWALMCPDPRYPDADRFALEVRHDHAEEIYPQGSQLFCVSYAEMKKPPEPGDHVIALRYTGSNLVEATVKKLQLDVDSGRLWLWSESHNPKAATPWPIDWQPHEWPQRWSVAPPPSTLRKLKGANDYRLQIPWRVSAALVFE